MLQYKKLNNIIGWVIWAIATFVYCSTIEPTASFWDCGEYIACAYKLEVGHPPGAPFFLIIARFFSLFAFGDVANAAMMINVMSALSSSFTILFLFWTITRLAKKMVNQDGEFSSAKMIAVLGAGIIGALAYTFSDSFWFSAVEGEVYAMSSFFTAIVFWAILKWEEESEEPSSMRWLVLISYLMGLSVGVHLLNLLVIPSICFIYYFKKHKFTWKSFTITGLLSLVLLGGVQGGIIPGIVKLAADFELLFVNKLGMPFSSGTLVYFSMLLLILISTILYSLNGKALYYKLAFYGAIIFGVLALAGLTEAKLANGAKAGFMRLVVLGGMVYALHYLKEKKAILNTIAVSFAVLLIGYSTFFILIIRSQANTPMDENNPENAISMLSYLNREQYGDWPIGYGNYYNAPLDKNEPYKDGNPVFARSNKAGKYVITDDRKGSIPNYDPEFCTPFPRMWSTQSNHEAAYRYWGDVKGRPKQVNKGQETETVYVPTFFENLSYFKNYQVRYMYWRYFCWNFVGKQNDVQGLNDNPTEGNWITGFKSLDESLYDADFTYMPNAVQNNKATNKFYGIPFILGLIGLIYQYRKNAKEAFVVGTLFFITGFAIVIYLNQYPYQPRERDYAYAASFYAYAIWIGMGVLGIFEMLRKRINPKSAGAIATIICMVAPILMAADGWDDHSRAKRTMSRDFAINYLNSCAPNAILFTNGDNDTFPLWYAQEVEGIRTDIRVVNLSLLQTDWYIDQMRRAAYDSKPVPFTLAPEKYQQGTRDMVYFMDRNLGYVDVKELMQFVNSDDPNNKLNYGDRLIDYFPSSKISVSVDSAKVVNNGTVSKEYVNRIEKNMQWEIKRQYILKNDLMVIDLLAANNWERPIYFAVTTGPESYLNMEQYLQLEGLAYRLVPVRSNAKEMQPGARVNITAMYDNIMNKFQWGGMKTPGVYLDENCQRMASNMRIQMGTLASALIDGGKKDLAVKVLDKAMEEMPEVNVPYDATVYTLILAYYQAGQKEKVKPLAQRLFDIFEKDLQFYNKLPQKHKAAYGRETRQCKEILSRLTTITDMYGDKGLSKNFEARLMNLIPAEELNPPQPISQ